MFFNSEPRKKIFPCRNLHKNDKAGKIYKKPRNNDFLIFDDIYSEGNYLWGLQNLTYYFHSDNRIYRLKIYRF